MNRDVFLATLRERLPGIDIRAGDSEDLLAWIPCRHKTVGDIMVYDRGSTEVMVFIGYSHDHFYCDNNAEDDRACAVSVANKLAELLDDLFHDRIVMWGVLGGLLAGGYDYVRPGERLASSWWCQRALWSRPL